MKRIDLLLVERGLAPTRSKAQQLIKNGEVQALKGTEWIAVTQANHVPAGEIRLKPDAQTLKYVSRGGLKLEAALNHLQYDVRDARALDLGLSTGGFTDCLLQKGAREILGVDVGHDQLHPNLRADSRLRSLEGVNVRELSRNIEVRDWLAVGGLDLCVADLSFISLATLLSEIARCLPTGTAFLGLVKPQFEVGAAALNKQGVVKDPALYPALEARMREAAAAAGFTVRDYFSAAIKGGDGNQEFFIFAIR